MKGKGGNRGQRGTEKPTYQRKGKKIYGCTPPQRTILLFTCERQRENMRGVGVLGFFPEISPPQKWLTFHLNKFLLLLLLMARTPWPHSVFNRGRWSSKPITADIKELDSVPYFIYGTSFPVLNIWLCPSPLPPPKFTQRRPRPITFIFEVFHW